MVDGKYRASQVQGGKLLHLLSCICYPASSQAVGVEQVRNSHLSAAAASSQMVGGRW